MNKLIRKNQEPAKGALDPGGYDVKSREKRRRISTLYDPAGGLGPINQFLYSVVNSSTGKRSSGEEQQYWETYLGLRDDLSKGTHRTEWDEAVEANKVASGENPSDFYGTTPRMDKYIQAVADTLHTGQMLRDYENAKAKYPYLTSKGNLQHIYETGKKVMDNPGTWQQAEEQGGLSVFRQLDSGNEDSPLGMLANFGMRWNPDKGYLEIHDTYDFPEFYYKAKLLPKRPKEMKIRGKINYDPKKGSLLFRE